MKTILTTLALLAMRGPVTVNVDAKDGDVISAEKTFRVTVQASNPITQVEFYVGEELRNTDTSTPYEFSLNPLEEADGSLKLTFAAYTSEGENAKKVINVKIDAGVSKGPDFHVERGLNLLANGKIDEAIMAGRIALKAKAGHSPARMLMARAYFAKGTYDQAQKFAEDVLVAEPNNVDARELISGISLQRAFSTVNRGGDRKDTLETIRVALKSAATNRHANLEARLDSFGAPNDANRIAYADAALRASRYSSVVNALQGSFTRDPSNAAVSNRLVYSLVRMGRFDDARNALNTVKRRAALDAYGNALAAVIEANQGNDAAADEAMKEAILADSEDLGVRTAQVYVALRRGRVNSMGNLVAGLAKDAIQRAETNYYLTIYQNATQAYTEAQKSFERAILAEPANYDMYIERANQALALAVSGKLASKEDIAYQYGVAGAFLEAAVAAKPDSPEALTGLSLAALLQGKGGRSLELAQAATKAGPNYAPGFYTLSCIASVLVDDTNSRAEKIRKEDKDGILDSDQKKEVANLENQARLLRVEVQRSRDTAEKLDKSNLSGRPIPDSSQAFTYYYRYGRMPLLTLPR